jgi:hypothetical protein
VPAVAPAVLRSRAAPGRAPLAYGLLATVGRAVTNRPVRGNLDLLPTDIRGVLISGLDHVEHY